jgi:L-ascorbate metabolism protein UlaG (beta-lactamase superfamily)
MIGGPFINYDASRVPQIEALIDKTLHEQAHLIRLAEVILQLDQVLSAEADGASLEPLYRKVPDELRGVVELVYDLRNHASIRFIEALLYRSRYYDSSAQTVELSLVEGDDRPFVFSTPRLENDERLRLNLDFAHPGIDQLFKMRRQPQSYGYIKECLQIEDRDDRLFSSLFTEQPPKSLVKYADDSVRVRYYGHACLLIESRKVSILLDPVVSYEHGNGVPRFTYADLPEHIDYVLITHSHQDHCMLETLLQLRGQVGEVIVPKNNGGGLADPSLKLALQQIGFKRVSEIDEFESVACEGGAITSLPFLGEHADLNIRTKAAYLVNLNGQAILCVADSNNLEPKLYELARDITGKVGALFIGMECDGGPMSWLYGPLLTKPLTRKMDQSRRFDGSDYEKAIQIVDCLRPEQVYVYAMGQEPWLTFLTSIQYAAESRPIIESDKLVETCRRRGIAAERLFGRKEIFLKVH